MEQEISLCPKCHKKPAVLWRNGYSYVICKKCRMATGLYRDWDEQMDSKKDAINAWNKKVEDAVLNK